jgi:hypothetical protein
MTPPTTRMHGTPISSTTRRPIRHPAETAAKAEPRCASDTETAEQDAIYHGCEEPDGRITVVVETPSGALYPLPHVLRHSPAGFNYGYNGNGPRDLALSILTDAMTSPSTSRSDIRRATRREPAPPPTFPGVIRHEGADPPYLRFTEEIIAHLPARKAWTLRRSDILRWLSTLSYPQPPDHSPQGTFSAPPEVSIPSP